MQLGYTEQCARIIGETLQLWVGSAQIYEIRISELIWYSESYPWEFAMCDWKLLSQKETENCIRFYYRSGSIEAEVLFCNAQKELRITTEFHNVGETKVSQFTAGLTLPVTGHGKNKVTIPHLIYNDNPSADPSRIVPHIGSISGEGIVVEEHRLPIPAVNLEWKQESLHSYLTLLSFPQIAMGEEEEYWSLGVLKEEEGERILSMSGPLMFNGMKDVVYAGRCTPLSYMKGYRCLNPNECLGKTYYLSWGQLAEEGKAFRNLVDLGYRVLQPHTVAQHSPMQMIYYKKQVLDSRFYQNKICMGYQTFGSANAFGNISGRPEYFLYGWTGQALKLSWCECMLGLVTEEKFRLERGIRTADFFVRNGESITEGLYKGYYLPDTDTWQGDWKNQKAALSSRIEGESISDLLDIMLLLQEKRCEVPPDWERAVKRVCHFLMDPERQTLDGIYPMEWQVDGTILSHELCAAGMPCVLVLVKASEYFGCPEYLKYAQEKYSKYASYHMETFDIPFSGATMDARCEDKEAGIYFFVVAAEIYRLTRDPHYRQWAEIAADWILTFVFFWETGFQKGTACANHDFCTTGWPGVSVQNHHLDVFFPTYELYSFGKLCGNARLIEMSRHISDAFTYGICTKEGEWGYHVVGEQGEQYYQTHYFQVPYPILLKYLKNFRGGMQVWNPSWITAQVMSSALKFCYGEDQ